MTLEELLRLESQFIPLSVFGGTLDDVLRKELFAARPASMMPSKGQVENHPVVPFIIQVLTKRFQELDGFHAEGIFRKSAEKEAVGACKRRLSDACYVVQGVGAIDTDDVHVVADVIKHWLRSLVEPLIPCRLYDRALEVSHSGNLDLAYKLYQELTPANQETLKYILTFLNKCADCAEKNHMNKNNLALVFSPNLIRNPTDDPLIMAANTEWEKRFIMYLMDVIRTRV